MQICFVPTTFWWFTANEQPSVKMTQDGEATAQQLKHDKTTTWLLKWPKVLLLIWSQNQHGSLLWSLYPWVIGPETLWSPLKGILLSAALKWRKSSATEKLRRKGKKKNPTKQNPPQQPRNPCTSYTWGRKRLSYLKGPSVLHRPYSPTLWVMTGQELTEQMCTFLFLWVFKRYMPACTHLHFWGFQSSNSVIWDLRTVLKIISQLSLHVLIDHS